MINGVKNDEIGGQWMKEVQLQRKDHTLWLCMRTCGFLTLRHLISFLTLQSTPICSNLLPLQFPIIHANYSSIYFYSIFLHDTY